MAVASALWLGGCTFETAANPKHDSGQGAATGGKDGGGHDAPGPGATGVDPDDATATATGVDPDATGEGSEDAGGDPGDATGEGPDGGDAGSSTGSDSEDAGDAEPPCEKVAWYLDADGDGKGAGKAKQACAQEPPGDDYVREDGDPQPECATDASEECEAEILRCNDEGGRERCVEDPPGCTTWMAAEACGKEQTHCVGEGECSQCVQHSDCSAARPVCEDGSCVGCTDPAACGGYTSAPVCEAASGGCVQCLPGVDEMQCADATPVCASDGTSCVECNGPSECKDRDAPRCDAHACTGCDSHLDCERFDDTPLCEADGDRCVQCNTDAQCTQGDKARCADHECRPCTENAQCDGLTRGGRTAEVCDRGDGECVECVTDADCGPRRLCVGDHYCVDGAENSAALCEACYDDRQCQQDAVCIAVEGGRRNDPTPKGECFPRQEGTGANACLTRGYLEDEWGENVRGNAEPHCTPVYASCEHMRRFRNPCNAPSDALCVQRGPDRLWSVQCGSLGDCPIGDAEVSSWSCTRAGQLSVCSL